MTSVIEAKIWLATRLDGGVECPCCTQFAKIYRRKINATQARELIHILRVSGTSIFHLPTVLAQMNRTDSHETAKLAYWQLIREANVIREDGGKHAGFWQLTADGIRYAQNELRVPKYARIFDGQLLGLEGEPTSILDALGTRFDYSELMSGV